MQIFQIFLHKKILKLKKPLLKNVFLLRAAIKSYNQFLITQYVLLKIVLYKVRTKYLAPNIFHVNGWHASFKINYFFFKTLMSLL